MKKTKLKKMCAHALSAALNNFGEGLNIGQLRTLDKVLNILEASLEEYRARLKEILKLESNKQLEAVEELNNHLGQQEDELEFSDEQVDLVKELWGKQKNFMAHKDARKIILEIADAIGC